MSDGIEILVGDVRTQLRTLPAASVHACVTSPPYWNLRDYQADGQIGLEATPELYVEHLIEVFREVRRVLRPDGSVWLNLGSSYYGGPASPLPITREQAAWLAALIDGEGCIQVHQQRRPIAQNCVDSFQCDVGVGMMTPELVQHAHAITDLGACGQQGRGVWDWSVRGQQAATLLRCIYPWLLGKRKQAALTIMLAEDLAARRYGRGNPAQPDVMAWRAEIKQAVSDLNQRKGTAVAIREPDPVVLEVKPKDDMGLPWMVAFALRADGWYLRAENIWDKPNAMPESVNDRPTRAHEQVFLLSPQARYFYDRVAVAEPLAADSAARAARASRYDDEELARQAPYRAPRPRVRGGNKRAGQEERGIARPADHIGREDDESGRNMRSVWQMNVANYPGAHFAVFPDELPERCIRASTSEVGVCSECGAPLRRVVESPSMWEARKAAGAPMRAGEGRTNAESDLGFDGKALARFRAENPERTVGWEPTCSHDAGTVPAVVLDPFGGAGTTAVVARRLGRNAVLVELNPEYAEQARQRCQRWWADPPRPREADPDQLTLTDLEA